MYHCVSDKHNFPSKLSLKNVQKPSIHFENGLFLTDTPPQHLTRNGKHPVSSNETEHLLVFF